MGKHQKWNASLAIQLCESWLRQNEQGDDSLPGAHGPDASGAALKQAGKKGATIATPVLVDASSKEALANARWPGRNQVLETGTIQFLLDGAHTAESCAACAAWLESRWNSESEETVGDSNVAVHAA